MLASGWLFTGVTALLITVIALLTQTEAARTLGDADGIAIVTGGLGTVLWGIFAYGSLNVEATSNGVVITFAEPAITLAAVAMALLPAYVALTGPMEIIESRYRDMQPDEY